MRPPAQAPAPTLLQAQGRVRPVPQVSPYAQVRPVPQVSPYAQVRPVPGQVKSPLGSSSGSNRQPPLTSLTRSQTLTPVRPMSVSLKRTPPPTPIRPMSVVRTSIPISAPIRDKSTYTLRGTKKSENPGSESVLESYPTTSIEHSSSTEGSTRDDYGTNPNSNSNLTFTGNGNESEIGNSNGNDDRDGIDESTHEIMTLKVTDLEDTITEMKSIIEEMQQQKLQQSSKTDEKDKKGKKDKTKKMQEKCSIS